MIYGDFVVCQAKTRGDSKRHVTELLSLSFARGIRCARERRAFIPVSLVGGSVVSFWVDPILVSVVDLCAKLGCCRTSSSLFSFGSRVGFFCGTVFSLQFSSGLENN